MKEKNRFHMPELDTQIRSKRFFLMLALVAVFTLLLCMPCNSPGLEHSRETAVVRAVRKVSPVVVNISAESVVRKRVHPFSGLGMDPYFESFFRDFFEPGFEQRYKRTSLGSGVIIDGKRGFILTNAHVIEKMGTITVVLKDKREFKAQIVGADPDSDLAVLRISAKDPLPAIEMGNSDDLMIGETVFAIGNPFGFSNTVTTGVVSATHRSIQTENMVYHDFIQTDASINPGNSGGPLLNVNGELIGINTAIFAKAQGIGFAIPINKAKRIVSDLIRYGEVIPAWSGMTVQDIDERIAQYLHLPHADGVLVTEIEKNSPAFNSGILNNDIILSVETKTIQSVENYQTIMKDVAAGNIVRLRLWRNKREINVSVKTEVFPLDRAKELAYRLLGVSVENLSSKNRFAYGTSEKEGVLISELQRQSYLAAIGVRPGDIIRQIDEITVKTTKDFEKAIIKYRQKKSVVILLQREDQLYYITVKL
ncbi:Do family serine endopeptidase [Thermodesulfobacteriota bacterium]